MQEERLTLASLCGGAVQEKVDRALEKVANNILDPNTDPKKKRVITLKITLKPDQSDYEDVQVSADVTYTLAPELGIQTRFFVNKDLRNDKVTVMEHKKGEIRGQLDFNDIGLTPEPTTKRTVDTETGEIMEESEKVGQVVDFRKHG
jgi:hypothetical protein